MGTMYGAFVGSALFLFAQGYLQELMGLASGALESVPVLSDLLSPDRWLLWMGVLFVLSVYYFPSGIVGRLRDRAHARALARYGATAAGAPGAATSGGPATPAASARPR